MPKTAFLPAAASFPYLNLCKSAQSSWWVSEIEGKAAKGSGERVGKRASFNSADAFIRVIRGCFALTQRCNF
jgi:hypothetical protein